LKHCIACVANTKVHFITAPPLPNFRGRLCRSAGQFNNQLFSFITSGIRRFYHSPELGGLNCFFISFSLSHISWKPAQKTNGPKHCQGQKKV